MMMFWKKKNDELDEEALELIVKKVLEKIIQENLNDRNENIINKAVFNTQEFQSLCVNALSFNDAIKTITSIIDTLTHHQEALVKLSDAIDTLSGRKASLAFPKPAKLN
jgi:hypothetical protein